MLRKLARSRLLPTFLLLAILPTLLLGIYGYWQMQDILRSTAVARQENSVTLGSERLGSFLQSVNDDLFYLRDSSAVNLYLSAIKSGDDKSRELMLKNLQTSLEDFSAKKRIYYRIRFLDREGMEIARIDRPTDTSTVISGDKLQNRKGSLLFEDSIKLPHDGLYVSQLELSKGEDGKVELPIRPVIRYATPVMGENNALAGVLVLDVAATNLLGMVNGQGGEGALLFIDKGGFYYTHPDENKTWGGKSDLNSGSNFYQDYPELVNSVEPNISLASFTNGGHMISLQPVTVGKGHQKLGTLLNLGNSHAVYAPARLFLLVTIGLLLLAGILAVLLAARAGRAAQHS
jgi:methyl-accepting chemotaxis protein